MWAVRPFKFGTGSVGVDSLASPCYMIDIAERLLELRERFSVLYITVMPGNGEAFGPIVSRFAGTRAPSRPPGMKEKPVPTYVLVHGAWHGGWYWRKVAPVLAPAGHNVLTPTLPWLGKRRRPALSAMDLDTHITDIKNVLAYEERSDAVLVSHNAMITMPRELSGLPLEMAAVGKEVLHD